jgi:hypothetical protein
MMKRAIGMLAALSLLVGSIGQAKAGFIPVSIGSQTNVNILTYTEGYNYPTAPANISVAGVPFDLITDQNTAGTLGVIQTPGGNSSFTITTSISRATTVYTLMNSAWGQSGANVGSIEFVGSGGENIAFQIVEGTNIRDHFNGGFNNSASNIVVNPFLNGVQNANGPDRLDMQTFVLPASFANDTLTQIIFNGSNAGEPQGQPFLAAATVETAAPVTAAPEPSTIALLGTAGVPFAGYYWRRRKQAVKA